MNTSPKPSRKSDLAGKPFGRWTVIRREPTPPGRTTPVYFCRCSCGVERAVQSSNLISGASKSCGCLNRELVKARFLKHGMSSGVRRAPEYNSWANMISRCTNPKSLDFHSYGGRGITVCERWRGKDGFVNFLADMGRKPTPKHTLERKRVNDNYQPDNCCWIPRSAQNDNKQNSTNFTHDGVTKTIAAWARHYGMTAGGLHYRLVVKSMPFEEAVSQPVQPYRRKTND